VRQPSLSEYEVEFEYGALVPADSVREWLPYLGVMGMSSLHKGLSVGYRLL